MDCKFQCCNRTTEQVFNHQLAEFIDKIAENVPFIWLKYVQVFDGVCFSSFIRSWRQPCNFLVNIQIRCARLYCFNSAPLHLFIYSSVDIVNGGCYEDRWNRMLTGKSNLNLPGNSPKACNAYCQGYQFYAVEYAKNCFCGNELQYAVKKPEGECNMKCRGDSSKQCGGFWRLNLYKTI